MSEINSSIFKANDIRGIYPEEINKESAEIIGRAFISLTGVRTIAVGRDMRLGGQELFDGLVAGLKQSGAKVIDLGMVSIDALYFAVGGEKYNGGIMITASHNPKQYNGFKMVTRDEKGINVIRGTDIKKIFESENFVKPAIAGSLEKKDIWQNWLRHIFSFVEISKIKRLKIVVDAGNGMAGKVMPLIEKRLPIELIKMNFKLDGNFPVHPSNPLMPESHRPLQERVINEGADVGFIFDGDTDRIFLVDNKGNFLRGDTTLILLAKYFLENKLGTIFVYNVICSRAVPEIIKKMGGTALREKVGYANLAERMKNEGGVLSGEVSGHYSFKENFYADSGFITFLIILQLLSQSEGHLSEMVEQFNPYFRSDEINIEIKDRIGKISELKQNYKDYQQDELDGVTVNAWEEQGWWLNVRSSNTEPLLRITVEAKTKSLQREKLKEVLKFVKQ